MGTSASSTVNIINQTRSTLTIKIRQGDEQPNASVIQPDESLTHIVKDVKNVDVAISRPSPPSADKSNDGLDTISYSCHDPNDGGALVVRGHWVCTKSIETTMFDGNLLLAGPISHLALYVKDAATGTDTQNQATNNNSQSNSQTNASLLKPAIKGGMMMPFDCCS